MEPLATIKEKEIFPDYQTIFEIEYKLRVAPRAVLLDSKNKIALLYVGKYNYHKLPGGGKRPGEDMENALKRECYEECGCNIEVVKYIGKILEYRDRIALKHETHGFLAKVVGEKKEPIFTQDERNSEYKLLWVDLDTAIGLMTNAKSSGSTDILDHDSAYFAKFIIKRELLYLMEAKNLLNGTSQKNASS